MTTVTDVPAARFPDRQLTALGVKPTTSETVPLHPGEVKTLSFIPRGETIVQAWVDPLDGVNLSYDQPLAIGKPRLIHLQLQDHRLTEEIALDVITENAAGKRHWHRFQLQPH